LSACEDRGVIRRALALLSLATTLAAVGASAAAPTGWPTWRGAATDVFRTGVYDHGEWIYTNGLRQARGANADGIERSQYYSAFHVAPNDPSHITDDLYNALTYDFFGSHRAAHNGDYQLPMDATKWPAGTADLAEVRMTVVGNQLFVRFLWNAMPRADAQIATLTFGGPQSAEQPWPHNAGLSGRYDVALTVWGSGATLGSAAVPVRVGDHVTEVRVPLALLPSGPWSLQGGSGLADPANPSQYWTVPAGEASQTQPGSGGLLSPTNVWDLLFAGDDPWSFDELSQSRQLTSGVTTSTATVDPAHLGSSYSSPKSVLHGTFSRLLHSAYGTKDGITQDTSGALGIGPPPDFQPPIPNPGFNVNYYYTGALQDYAMNVPPSYDGSRKTPLVLYLHGITGLPEEPFRNPTGLVPAIAAKGWLFASALGRGDWFYRGGTPGDADVLEVLADVKKRYNVDPDRVYLMGHSMGGYGTNNVAMHHPDLFAAVAPAEGTDSADLHANLRNTPWLEMTAEEDLDTQAKNAKALYASLSADGYDATLLDYQLKIHEYSSIYDTIPRLLAFFAAHKRQTDPAVVSWTRPVGQDNAKLGERYDGAWWLREVEPASGVTRPTITVERLARYHQTTDATKATRSDTMVDEQGPTMRSRAELFVTTPSSEYADYVPGTIAVRATGVRSAAATLADGDWTSEGGTRSLTIRSTTNAAMTLTLTGASGRAHRLVDGRDTGIITAGVRGFAVGLPAGIHVVQLIELTPPVDRPPLATTGTRGALPLLGLLLLVLAGLSARRLTR
jgi:poly(3-hydroxybutyrate) depolymerase